MKVTPAVHHAHTEQFVVPHDRNVSSCDAYGVFTYNMYASTQHIPLFVTALMMVLVYLHSLSDPCSSSGSTCRASPSLYLEFQARCWRAGEGDGGSDETV